MDADEIGREVWESWRDGMLAQGRAVPTERMAWETLSEADRELDRWIGWRVADARERTLRAGLALLDAMVRGRERHTARTISVVAALTDGRPPHCACACHEDGRVPHGACCARAMFARLGKGEADADGDPE